MKTIKTKIIGNKFLTNNLKAFLNTKRLQQFGGENN